MDLQKQQRLIIDALEDAKARDIKVFNTTHLTGMFDRIMIVSGTSGRQTRAIAQHVVNRVREKNITIIAEEGMDSAEWILIDTGDIVVHVMQPATREYYNLEEIWGERPVRVKLLPESTVPVSSEPAGFSDFSDPLVS